MRLENTRELAFVDWKKGMKAKQISEKYGVSVNTVRSWAARYWKNKAGDAENKKKAASITSSGTIEKNVDADFGIIPEAVSSENEQNDALTEKKRLFCVYFLTSFDAARAYLKAFGGSRETAGANGYRLLTYTNIQKELRRLRNGKASDVDGLCGDDVVGLHMRIAFADITDFIEFEGRSVPVKESDVDSKDGKEMPLTKTVNEVRFKDSKTIDGQLINEVSVWGSGAKIKLADRQRSMQFLERHFELNPMDRHKKEYDDARLALEERSFEAKNKKDGGLVINGEKDGCVNISVGGEEF